MNPRRRARAELLEWASCAESELDTALSALQELRRRATSELETCDA